MGKQEETVLIEGEPCHPFPSLAEMLVQVEEQARLSVSGGRIERDDRKIESVFKEALS